MTETNPNQADRVAVFGPFRLLPDQRLLLEDGRPVDIGARALSILIALVGRGGDVITKTELMARVWPDTHVEDGNLRAQILALRRVLRDGQAGNRYIMNLPGRGYGFVAPIAWGEAPVPPGAAVPQRANSLPPSLTNIFGRSEVVDALRVNLPQRRFVTVIGPGGIGKTTVAIAVARELAPTYRDGVVFIDLAAIGDPKLVPSALSSLLGLAVPSEDVVPAMVTFLRQKHLLLVLDSCEHVIEIVASLAEQISNTAPDVHILATSREPLRAAGERVHRLTPFELPPVSDDLTAAEAMSFPGIQLFVERAAATLDGFALSDAEAPIAAAICRRLDGIALAIELAAGHVAAFGPRGLLARLDDRFALLARGRRTALSRHQTLAATLDWSYELLAGQGRRLLRRLAVFSGDFSLDAAAALFDGDDPSRLVVEIGELVSKSLVVADINAEPARYRLLDTTRLYGIEKLKQAGELEQARGAHAAYFRVLFTGAETASERLPQSDWLAAYANQIGNVRAALDWAGSEGGDTELYVALTIGAVPLWVQLSLMNECRGRVEAALGMLTGPATEVARSRMRLLAARAWSLMYAAGQSREVGSAWASTMALAEQLGDTDYRLRAFWGIWINLVNKGDIAEASDVARRLSELVADSSDSLDHILADRLMGSALHYRGEQEAAWACLERMLCRYAAIGNQPRVARFQVDPRATAQTFMARILWLRGFPDDARRLVETNIAEGLAVGQALSLSNVLGQGACLIALFTGDFAAARRHAAMLLDHERKHGLHLHLWHDWTRCFNGLLAIKAADIEAGLAVMRSVFEITDNARISPRYSVMRGEYAAALGRTGMVTAGLETIDALLGRFESRDERWYEPEALRIKGELVLLSGASDADAAGERSFREAMSLARRQGARSWELRAVTSLARLKSRQGRDAEARSDLSEVLASFTQGFDTSDVREAMALASDTPRAALGSAAAATNPRRVPAGAPTSPRRTAVPSVAIGTKPNS